MKSVPSCVYLVFSTSPTSPHSSGSKLKYIIYALGALVVLYVMNRGVGLFRGKSSARLSCGYYEFSACKEQGVVACVMLMLVTL